MITAGAQYKLVCEDKFHREVININFQTYTAAQRYVAKAKKISHKVANYKIKTIFI